MNLEELPAFMKSRTCTHTWTAASDHPRACFPPHRNGPSDNGIEFLRFGWDSSISISTNLV